MFRPPNSSRFDHPNTIGWEYRSLSSSLCVFLHSPATSSLLGPNILLSTLFSNTLSLSSSLNVSDQVLHPYNTTGRILIVISVINNSENAVIRYANYLLAKGNEKRRCNFFSLIIELYRVFHDLRTLL